MFIKKILLTSFLFLFVTVAFAQDANQIVQDRQENFKAIRKNVKAINRAFKSGKTADEILPVAKKLQVHMGKVYGFFPENSKNPTVSSEALPVIWENNAKFKKTADNATEKSQKLVAVLSGKDINAAKAAFSELGKSCKSCHKTFRE